MPDIGGIRVLKEIRKSFPNTVCLIATGFPSYETAVEATREGAFGYIPKPFSPEELQQKLSQAFYKRQVLLESEKWKKEREERMLEIAFEKSRLNTIINSISDGLLVVNSKGEVVLYNPSALRYLSLDNIVIEEKISDKLPAGISELINKFLSGKNFEKKSYSTQIEVQPGGLLFIEATTSAVPHPDGTLAGVVVVLKDITEMKKIEHLKSQFVSMVSHELKAPVAAVYGYLNLLDGETVVLSEEQKKKYIVRSQFRLENLLKMVNDLLDISRIEMKTVNREIKEVKVDFIIKNILEMFALEIQKKNITTDIKINDLAGSIHADSDEIARLFTNILSNAVKYNKAGGRIDINISSCGGFVVAQICDTGIGLKPEEMEKLFHEFYRAKNEQTKNIGGTGLGLSIVKRIVDSYAGKIEVESTFGSGSCFKIFLPIRPSADEPSDKV
jgi:PAS domain S-box-containing protein